MNVMRVLMCALILALPACGGRVPTPGYDGDVPGILGQELIREISGKPMPAEFTSGDRSDWTIGGFAVIPNPVSPGGKGPVLVLNAPDGARTYLPVNTDDEAIDLYTRVTGHAPARQR